MPDHPSHEPASCDDPAPGNCRCRLRLLPTRSNDCLDEDLASIEADIQQLLTRGLPYEPYMSRFNHLQGLAEKFRTLVPRPLPGTAEKMVTVELTAAQLEEIDTLRSLLCVLRQDLRVAATTLDESATGTRTSSSANLPPEPMLCLLPSDSHRRRRSKLGTMALIGAELQSEAHKVISLAKAAAQPLIDRPKFDRLLAHAITS